MSDSGSPDPCSSQVESKNPEPKADNIGMSEIVNPDTENLGGDYSETGSVYFPPPNSWYKSQVAAARDDMWAYIALNVIVKVDQAVPPTNKSGDDEGKQRVMEWPKFTLIGIMRDLYISIGLCQAPWEELPLADAPLVSGCEGGSVRIWNVVKNQCPAMHTEHKGSSVIAVSWSTRNNRLIYSMDEKGNLVRWDILAKSNATHTMNFGKAIVATCMQASPYENERVAFGSKGGTIYIVDTTGTGKVLHKMRHEEEISALAWRPPTSRWKAMKEVRKPVFATTVNCAKPPTVRVWGHTGEDICILFPWGETDSKTCRPQKVIGTCAWIQNPITNSQTLVSPGRQGDIVSWTKDSFEESIHKVHANAIIFGFIQCGDILWSFSYAPIIIGWNLRLGRTECVIPTARGLNCVVPSPLSHTRVAVGGADNFIRVIQFGSEYPNQNAVKEPLISQRLKGKVYSLAWHPKKDTLIGFGTSDGMMGIFDLTSHNKAVTYFDRRLKACVYSVSWGPPVEMKSGVSLTFGNLGIVQKESPEEDPLHPEEEKWRKRATTDCGKFLLYGCGGHTVGAFDPSKVSNPLISVERIIETSNKEIMKKGELSGNKRATDIRWTPDLKFCAVAYKNGRVEIYSPPYLELKCWIKCQSRAINLMVWRPYDFSEDKSSTHCEKFFAVASNDNTVCVFNLQELFENGDKEDFQPLQIVSSFITFKGHGKQVISLAWSPHNPDLIISCSFDKTACIWNVRDGTYISRYSGHQHRLVDCLFHPSDEFRAFTVSDELSMDFSFHVWDYRKHPYTDAPLKLEKSTPQHESQTEEKSEVQISSTDSTTVLIRQDNKSKAVATMQVPPSGTGRAESRELKKKEKAKQLFPFSLNKLINSVENLDAEFKAMLNKVPLSNNLLNHSGDVADLESFTEEDLMKQVEASYLDSFGNKEESLNLAKVERDLQEKKGNWEAAVHISCWLDDMAWIKKEIQARRVNELIIFYAFMKSRRLFVSAVKIFAEKCLEEKQHYKAVDYLILIQEFEQAVEILVGLKLFKDAITLITYNIELSDSKDNLMTKVKNQWIEQLMTDGNYELAAKIHASMGQLTEALAAVEKRNKPYAWRAAIYLADKLSDTRKVELLGIKLVQHYLGQQCYESCYELTKTYAALTWFLPIIMIHEMVTSSATTLKKVDSLAVVKDLKTCGAKVLEAVKSEELAAENEAVVKKIKNTLLMSVPLERHEALFIICKNIVVAMLSSSEAKQMTESAIRTAEKWFSGDDKLHILLSIRINLAEAVPEMSEVLKAENEVMISKLLKSNGASTNNHPTIEDVVDDNLTA